MHRLKTTAFAGIMAGLIVHFWLPSGIHAAPLTKLLGSLQNSTGESASHCLQNDYKLQVLCFLGSECPLARLYGPRLKALSEDFQGHDVSFVGINSNPQDSLADVESYVKDFEIPFPILKDHDQIVLNALDAKRTPEVVVLDSAGTEIYRGRIDDQYQPGVSRLQPTRQDLRVAIEEYIENKSITTPRTEAVGCLIARPRISKADSSITFCKQIVRLLKQHCTECHRPGEIGPFSLTEYDEVIGWADMMQETIAQRRMPPWNANPEHGHFVNARMMPNADRELIHQWVTEGTPFGDASDLPPLESGSDAQSTESHFDLEIPMRSEPYNVAAEGTIEYQYFVVDPKFDEDRWVQMAELTPSNRSVVHHGIVFIRPPDGIEISGIGWLTAYVPGQVRVPSPAHRARRIPAGSKLVFQMHYTPNGKPQQDQSVLRLTFADPSEITEEHISLISLNQELEIPAGETDVPVHGRTPYLPPDGMLLALSPHMHLRGKSMRVEATTQTDSNILLDVPKYDFNWQHTYILRDPIELKSLKELTFHAKFDNSKDNPFNPDPTAFVTWGDQTWEEMAIVFYEVAVPLVRKNKNDKERTPSERSESELVDKTQARQQLVTQLFLDLDQDRDGKHEQPCQQPMIGVQEFGHGFRRGCSYQCPVI